jgi:hypothetical protein
MATTTRWMKFWPQDWEADECLKVCSLAARGLWAAMICLMHKADPYGHLLVNGKAPDAKRLAAVIGAATEREVAALLNELEGEGVFSRTDKGVIYSRRMVRDKEKSEAGRQYGLDGGNPALMGGVKGPGMEEVNGHAADGITEGVGPTLVREAEREKEKESKQPSARNFGGLEEFVVQCDGKAAVGDFYLDPTVEQVYEAARIDNSRWRGNIRPLIEWMHEGIEPSTIVRAIRRRAERPGYKVPDSLNYFKNNVHEEHGRQK